MQSNKFVLKSLRARFTAGLITLALFAAGVTAQIGPIEDLAAFPSHKLEFRDGKTVRHVFQVWLADTGPRQMQGLMFVRSLPQMHGMLFVHEQPETVSMWMKNTFIPLDMVFIGANGKVQEIIADTTPHSETTIRSKNPALAVLEIGGGEAKRLGLHPGQRVVHPALVRH